jgi:NRPS condensation-like uncharacterized protein
MGLNKGDRNIMKPSSVTLNQSDFLALAMNNVFPSLGQVITIRFKTKYTPDEIRQAMRKIVALYDRLRLYVKPTLFSHRIHVYDNEDAITERYFDEAFRVLPGLKYESPEYGGYRNMLLNEPYSLTSGLPLRISFLPDDPEQVLLLSVHHLVCDGIGWVHMVEALMAILNGESPPAVPLENPSLTNAIIEKPFYRFPFQLMRSYIKFRENARERKNDKVFVPDAYKASDTFDQCRMQQKYLSIDLQALKKKAKELDCTITVLTFAALARAMQKWGGRGSSNSMYIYFLIDLRPYFNSRRPIYGNFVSSGRIRILVKSLGDDNVLIREIKKELDRNLSNIRNMNLLYPFLLNKISTFMGVGLYKYLTRYLKRKGKLTPALIVSNLGNLDRLNSHGSHALLGEALATISTIGIFFTMSSMKDRMSLNISYPCHEYLDSSIEEYVRLIEVSLEEIINSRCKKT